MPSVDSLRRRVATMRARSNRDWLPRTWCFILESDDEFPEDVAATIKAQMRANDVVYIRYITVGYMGPKEGDWTWGTVHWHGGAAIVKQDGTLKKVGKR